MADVQLTQTAVELQTSINAVEDANAGLDTVVDLSSTTATAAKLNGFHGLGASSTAAPSTDRSVMLTLMRDVDATSEIRYGQIVITESNGMWWNSDTNGTLSGWLQVASLTGTETLANKTLASPTFTGTTTAAAINASGEFTVTGTPTVATTGEGKLSGTSTNGGGVTGFGSTYDSFLGSRGGGVAVGVLSNSLNVVLGGSATVSNVLNLKPVEVTVASGAIARTASVHVVDTEGGAGTDDLHTISGGVEGDILVLYSSVAARDTTVKDQTTLGSGNINLAGGADFSLSHPYDKLVLIFRAVQWDELTRSNNL